MLVCSNEKCLNNDPLLLKEHCPPDIIVRFIEDQAFLWSYDSVIRLLAHEG